LDLGVANSALLGQERADSSELKMKRHHVRREGPDGADDVRDDLSLEDPLAWEIPYLGAVHQCRATRRRSGQSRRSVVTSQSGTGSGGSAHSPLNLLFCLLPRPAVPGLEESNELFGFALNAIELIVRQLTPP
jgi:hypothetical protein